MTVVVAVVMILMALLMLMLSLLSFDPGAAVGHERILGRSLRSVGRAEV